MNNLVAPWVRRFLVEYLIGERNYSPNTQHSHRDALRLFLPFVAQQCRCAAQRSIGPTHAGRVHGFHL